MNVTSKKHKYSRLVEQFPVEEGVLTIVIASVRTITSTHTSGEITKTEVIQGPTTSIEFLNQENNFTKVNYELSPEEFDELLALHQTNKEAFINYSKG